MSVRVMAAVFDSQIEDKPETLVLLALANHCNDDGVCYPSIRRIAQLSRLTERGVQKVVSRLEDRGILSRNVGGGRGGASVYQINLSALNPEPGSPPNPVHPPNASAETPNASALNPEPRSPEPSITIKEPSVPPVGPPEKKPPKTARLPEGWVLPAEGWRFAISKKLTHDEIEELANDFHIYWTDIGTKRSERGWNQAWRNRVSARAPQIIRSRRFSQQAHTGGLGQDGSLAGVLAQRRITGQN